MGPFDNTPGGFMFDVFPILFTLLFFLIIGVFILNIIKGISTWHSNNQQPNLRVVAKIVAKRQDISRSVGVHHNDGIAHHHSHTYTRYFVTFEVESGDRMEFNVEDIEYGKLVEGDKGMLNFQGSRYLGFERMKNI